MDTLNFGTPVLLRHLTFSEARKMPISEINLEKALEGLGMTMDQVNPVFCIYFITVSLLTSVSCWGAITAIRSVE
jgi:hypothetical protein